jgi:hypothetical protein
MNWFKIKIQIGNADYIYNGSSTHSLDELVEQAIAGKFLRLDDLFYTDRGEVKDWASWDKREMPSVRINPKMILTIQQYKADPKTLAK